MRRSDLLPLAIAGVVLYGCGDPLVVDPQAEQLAKQLLSLITVATEGGVAHSGDRLVERHYTDDEGFPQSLVYREHIEVDGLGGFDLTPLEVLSLDAGTEGEFLLKAEARAAFHFRYRDFAVRDLERFLDNYQLQALGSTITVAGRDGVPFLLSRVDDPQTYHRLVADVETGLILRAREFALDGTLLSSVEYETLDLGAPAGFVPFDSPFDESPLAADQEDLRRPTWVPESFGLDEATQIRYGTRSWTKLVYTDGLEPLFLLYGDSLDAVPSEVAAPGVFPASSPDGLGAAADAAETPYLQRVPVGDLTALRLIGWDEDVLAVGSIPEDDLQLFLESLVD